VPATGGDDAHGLHVTASEALNRRELQRYVSRVSGRWPLDRALLGGARVADLRGAGPQRERGQEYVVVLVSESFGGVPWLERVYQAGSLWDADEMGARADVHCYTPSELERRVQRMRIVGEAVSDGIDLLAS
jgi:hypothetical protein